MSSIAPSYRTKLDWAQRRLGELEAEILAFDATTPYEAFERQDPANAERLEMCLRINRPISDSILMATGDVVHNARAALDHLACAAVGAANVTPNTAFPFWRKPSVPSKADFKALCNGKVKGASTGFVNLLLQMQPYEGGADDAVWALDYLDRMDKHRLLIEGIASYESISLLMRPSPDFPATRVGIPPAERFPLTDGTVLFNAPAETMRDMSPEAKIDIALGEPASFKGKVLLPAVTELVKVAGDVIDRLEPLI